MGVGDSVHFIPKWCECCCLFSFGYIPGTRYDVGVCFTTAVGNDVGVVGAFFCC